MLTDTARDSQTLAPSKTKGPPSGEPKLNIYGGPRGPRAEFSIKNRSKRAAEFKVHLLVTVMRSALDYLNAVAGYPIHDPVAGVNPAAPIAGKITCKRLGLADTRIPAALDVLDENIDTPQSLPVVLLPIQIIIPCIFIPRSNHPPP